MIQVLDKGYIKIAEPEEENVWGSDENVIRAARMSTNKGFLGWENDHRLLSYLWKHKHYTPFEMAGLVCEVHAPIVVFREWHRHRTFSFNEMSGRYSELPNEYYIPSIERLMNGKQSAKNKQGSEEGFSEGEAVLLQETLKASIKESRATYEALLKTGVSRELARLVLPVNQYSRMWCHANLRNWFHFLTLRLDTAAQWEIRQFAEGAAQLIKSRFPRTYALFEAEFYGEPNQNLPS